MQLPLLPIKNLDQRHKGISQPLADSYLEAARVSLDRHHTPPQEFVVNDDSAEDIVLVEWDQTDERSKLAWANDDDATRDGAYACAIAATELTRGLIAVGRAETHTGADYYLAPIGEGLEDLENCIRLEVSGTNSDDSGVRTRLYGKVKQALNGDSDLPAIAAVVGFRARLIMIKKVE